MYNNYKIVCNTAAGRRRYMQYLIPQVICSDIVDRYDIWVNTTDKKDIAFFEMLATSSAEKIIASTSNSTMILFGLLPTSLKKLLNFASNIQSTLLYHHLSSTMPRQHISSKFKES